jgi:hypothetical protein
VLIILSDELYRVPRKLPARVVFKQYVSSQDTTCIPFPLGVRNEVPALPFCPIAKRSIDVGFLGRMYPHRKAFLGQLSSHAGLREFHLDLTSDLRRCVSEYAEFLNNTKVSLCLPGNSSPETFRFYESIRAGCIVITAMMPPNGLYAAHPGFQANNIDDVDEVAELVRSILVNPGQHEHLQQRSLDAWNGHYSPAAVAGMVKRVVATAR